MKNRIIFSLFFVFGITCLTFAKQDKYLKHTVAKGETIAAIAQKYKVTPFDIYKLNPDSQNGIQLNSVLLIPPSSVEETALVTAKQTTPKTNSNPTTHLVQPKETLYSISRQYGVTVDALREANADLLKDGGLKIGQTIKIPASNGQVATTVEPVREVVKETPKPVVKAEPKAETPKGNVTYHVIEPKETKYGISKKYGMTIQELERLNPAIANDFPIGLKLVVSGNPQTASRPETTEPVKSATAENSNTSGKKYLQEYVVKPKETVQSIARDFGISENELIQLNPELKKGVKLGMILRVPLVQKANVPKKEQGNLMKNLNTNARKQLALLLPFNISKIESDTVNSTQARLKKDKFLNMTLDFYSGVLMAVDSANVLGLNVDIKILDSQETKNSSNVATLAEQNNLSSMDAVIGPFYQSNVEKLAEILEPSKTPVISPLSKDLGKRYSNLYQSMPSIDQMRSAVFQFMKSKGGNILAVVDPKKGSVTQYLKEMQSETKIVGLSDKGGFVADSLKIHLNRNTINYVVLASESTGMILATTNAMLSFQKEYPVQLVIMEPNETLDFEEISLARLTKLKLLYPSLSRPNETDEANQFDAKYKKINKIIPNPYAVRGFDVTFDTLLRLSQEKSFEETIQSEASEQIENKFDYVQENTYGYSNNGIYILNYDEDLTVKEAL